MQRLLSFLLLISILPAFAAEDTGPQSHLIAADTVYLVTVTAAHDHQVVFSVTETLKGRAKTVLTLTPEPGFAFKLNTEWLLISMPPGGKKDAVGTVMKEGWSEWYPVPVTRDDEKVTVTGIGSLEQTKDILRQSPAKS